MSGDKTPKLELAEMIKALRAELAKAQTEGEGKEVRFTVEDVEVELEIAVEEKMEGSLAAKFYVLTSKLKGEKKDAVTQKFKLKLKPHSETVDPQTGEKKTVPTRISSEE